MRREVALHRVELRQGIRDGRTGGKDEAAPVGDLVDVLRLHVEIPCLFDVRRCADAGDLGVARGEFEIFEAMRLVNDELVDAKLLEGDGVVVVLGALFLAAQAECFVLLLEGFDGADGKIFRLAARGIAAIRILGCLFEAVDDAAVHGAFPAAAELDAGELRLCHDDGIPVLRGDTGDEFLAPVFLEIAVGGDENLRLRIESLEFLAGLRRQMVRDDDERLVAHTEALCLHDGSCHLERLASADAMREKRIAAVQAVRDGIPLVGLQMDGARHAGEDEFRAVVRPQAETVEVAVVVIGDDLRVMRIFEQPRTECRLELLLLHLCLRRALDIERTDGIAIRIEADLFFDARVLLVQAVQQEIIDSLAGDGKCIFCCRRPMLFLLDAPLARLWRIADIHLGCIVGVDFHRVDDEAFDEVGW